MTIKVTIKRHVRHGKEAKLNSLLIELRSRSLRRNGYLSGETLVSAADPTVHMVVGSWASIDDWRSWEHHPERQELVAKINELLVSPAEVEVWSLHGPT